MNVANLFRLDEKVAVVTGAARGIGRMAAITLCQAGASVIVADIDADAASETAAELQRDGLTSSAMPLDVGDEDSVVNLFSRIADEHGRLDILINSAGTARRTPSEETSLEIWNHVIAINLTGTFLCCREAAKIMLKQQAGSIINLASIMGHGGGGLYPNPSYHASKGGVVNLTRALAAEWGGRGIRVNDLAPTFVNTRFAAAVTGDPELRPAIENLTPLGRIAEVEDIAGAILYLASPASAMVTGHSLAIDGGWLAR